MQPPILIVGQGTAWVRLGRVHLTAGKCGLISGPTGTGKTSVLQALAGVAGWDGRVLAVDGGVAVPVGTACPVALVPHVAETDAARGDVAETVGRALRGLPLGEGERERRIAGALADMGLSGLAARRVDSLSMGERHGVAIAAALARDPAVLLLDEPFAALDHDGVQRLRAAIRRRLSEGRIILLTAHAEGAAVGLCSVHLRMPLRQTAGATAPAWAEERTDPSIPAAATTDAGRAVLRAQDLRVLREDGAPLLDRLTLSVAAGGRTHICGLNGAGKSTLLRCLIGAAPVAGGSVTVMDVDNPAPRDLPGRVGFLPQEPPRHFFGETVRSEIGFALTRAGLRPPDRRRRVEQAIDRFGLAPLADRPPQSLSAGERRLVTLAGLVAGTPRLLLLDDPLRCLDPTRAAHALVVLSDMARASGTAILSTSHSPLTGWADQTLRLQDGRLHRAA
jgi:energy-coupling factor transport system ATP-binding protein